MNPQRFTVFSRGMCTAKARRGDSAYVKWPVDEPLNRLSFDMMAVTT